MESKHVEQFKDNSSSANFLWIEMCWVLAPLTRLVWSLCSLGGWSWDVGLPTHDIKCDRKLWLVGLLGPDCWWWAGRAVKSELMSRTANIRKIISTAGNRERGPHQYNQLKPLESLSVQTIVVTDSFIVEGWRYISQLENKMIIFRRKNPALSTACLV